MTPRIRSLTLLPAIVIAFGGLGAISPLQAQAGSLSGSTRDIPVAGVASFAGSTSPNLAIGSETHLSSSRGGDGGTSDRSHSGMASAAVGAIAQPRQVTTSSPGLLASFDGMDHFDMRWGTTAGANMPGATDPPDQGLCVGNDGSGHTRVLEVLNGALRVFTGTGQPLTPPVATNLFFGYPPRIIRTPVFTEGPALDDPACLYDAPTGRWFLDTLTQDIFPQDDVDGSLHFTGANRIDLAVSNTSDPAGEWTHYQIPLQDDGTEGTPNHHCSAGDYSLPPFVLNPTACVGDYPHIGADAYGIYITTNEYSYFGPEFRGAQIYALPKAGLVALAPTVPVTQFDTHGADRFGFAVNGFTLWPSTTPGGGGDQAAGGTEYFLSTNAAPEAHDAGDGLGMFQPSTQLLVWALINTSSLATNRPLLALRSAVLGVGGYSIPPAAAQKSGPQPFRQCLNDNVCALSLVGITDPYAEQSASLDSNDTRMQQVTWAGGHLWGAIDTALNVASNRQAGIEWFDVVTLSSDGGLGATLSRSGYVGLGNDNLIYPAIGITSRGTGVMAFTLVGPNFYPSAAYATITAAGVSDVHVAATGQGPADSLTEYKLFGPLPGIAWPRFGDYGAAVPVGTNVWIASEYIGQTCSFAEWQRTDFLCGGTRSAYANWDTRISEVSAP